MKAPARFAAALVAVALAIAVASAAVLFVLRGALPAQQQALFDEGLAGAAGTLLFVIALLVAALALPLRALFRRYVLEPKRLAEETRLVATINPSHRVSGETTDSRALSDAINALAARYEALERDVASRIAAASEDLAEERNRFAALLSELAESVVVCNAAGRVLLYNDRAARLLSPPSASTATAPPLGLGRSLFATFDAAAIAHAIEDLRHRLARGETDPVSVFVITCATRQIRARMAPVRTGAPVGRDTPDALSGFVLVLEDVTRAVENGRGRDEQLAVLVQRSRATVASIRAAVENLLAHPQLEPAQRDAFLRIIAGEAEELGGYLAQATAEHRQSDPAQVLLRGSDLLAAFEHSVRSRTDTAVTVAPADDDLWIAVDRLSTIAAVTALVWRLRESRGVHEVRLSLHASGPFARITLAWSGAPLDVEAARTWLLEKPPQGCPVQALDLGSVLRRHDGEAWYAHDEGENLSCFRILLPLANEAAHALPEPSLPSRPTFYDFDLFHQRGQSAALDERALRELVYTVFDTETTGLAPSQGDEIVSIGAVRIVNGRVLRSEVFEQLVDPRRRLPAASTRIHGITNEMVRGAPSLKDVLPAFHRFCAETVLVGHNAAFDLRFFQLKEAATGVVFDHPVLDTLMLSAVIHPNQSDHTIEAIAQRLGVNVTGRHRALGDALVTAEAFVKMLPLLAERGIRTLGEARAAASRTPYARVTY